MTRTRLHIAWFIIFATACGKPATEDHTIHAGQDSTKVNEAIRMISRSVNQVVLSSQKTIKLSHNLSKQTVTASGYITFDERRNNIVAIRTSGRIEKLYVKYNYQFVKKGERIAELYSPELNTYQEEYLFLLKSGEDSLASKAKQKLKLLGLLESQIQQVEKSNSVTQAITITSPIDGFIRFSLTPSSSEETKSASSTGMGEMSEAFSSNTRALVASAGQIREGMYVNKGQTLFVVNDVRQVWALLSVNISSQVQLKKGVPVTLYSEVQTDSINTKIDLVEPVYEDKQRFVRARIYLDNPGRIFKINSLVNGKISSQAQALTVPLSSVYDLGSRKIVWVKTGITSSGVGLFEPHVVTIGMTLDNWIEIITGLKGDEEIALDAGYMLDSESILNEKQ
ncbi:MAG: efflux RND transporter periplasmic adaptor subunit [Chryseolinea sp.]